MYNSLCSALPRSVVLKYSYIDLLYNRDIFTGRMVMGCKKTYLIDHMFSVFYCKFAIHACLHPPQYLSIDSIPPLFQIPKIILLYNTLKLKNKVIGLYIKWPKLTKPLIGFDWLDVFILRNKRSHVVETILFS